ncbi:UNVERIFIED_CONTAM: hypothetical protein K2H54_052337 [Gekko kuhli]
MFRLYWGKATGMFGQYISQEAFQKKTELNAVKKCLERGSLTLGNFQSISNQLLTSLLHCSLPLSSTCKGTCRRTCHICSISRLRPPALQSNAVYRIRSLVCQIQCLFGSSSQMKICRVASLFF